MNIYLIKTSDNDKVIGVGQTTRSFEERHKDGDWAKLHNKLKADGHELELIHWWADVDISDHEIHAWLKTQPGVRRFAEWFRISSTPEIIENMIHENFFSGYEDERDELILKPYQKDFVTKARSDYDEFLLAAKCRAGKSVMVLSHILDKGHRVSLVVSRFVSPSQSWIEDVKKFSCFENMVTVSLSDKNWQSQVEYWMTTNNQIILWSTIQGVIRKVDNLPSIDLLVYDEAHIGDRSSQFLTLRESVTCPCLKVSGTAYDQLWDTTEDNRFVYDYFQEQIDVKNGLIQRPTMEVILANYESDRYSEVYGDDPDAMKNLFLIENDVFVDEFLVKEFIAKFFDTNRGVRPKDRLLSGSNHIYMCLPSVKACHLVQQLLDPIIPTKVVTGDTKTDADKINQFVQEHNRSICLTYSANVLGVTQSLWDTVINAREGKSIQFWTQFAFRAGSGDHNWKVIDFVPSRALESLRETFCLANDLDSSLSEYEFVDFVPIHEWNNGFTTLSVDEVNQILSANIGSTTRLMTGATEGIDLERLMDIDFGGYVTFDREVTKRVILNEEGNNGEGAKKLTSERTKAEKTELQQKIRTLKSILSLVPQVIFEERLIGSNINTIQDVIDSKSYPIITNDTNNLITEMMDSKVIVSSNLSRRVNQTRISIDNSLVNGIPSEVLFELQISTGVSQGIPTKLFNQMIDIS